MCSFYFIAFYSYDVETESFNTHVLESWVHTGFFNTHVLESWGQTGSLKKTNQPCMNAHTDAQNHAHTHLQTVTRARACTYAHAHTHREIHTQKPKYVYDEMRHASLNSTEPRRSQRRLSMGPTFGPNLPWQHFHPDQAVPWKIYG